MAPVTQAKRAIRTRLLHSLSDASLALVAQGAGIPSRQPRPALIVALVDTWPDAAVTMGYLRLLEQAR